MSDQEITYPRPVGDRLLCRIIDEPPSRSGIALPEGCGRAPIVRAVVVYVGPGYRTYDGHLPLEMRAGDEVLFNITNATEVDVPVEGQPDKTERLHSLHEQAVMVILSGALRPVSERRD